MAPSLVAILLALMGAEILLTMALVRRVREHDERLASLEASLSPPPGLDPRTLVGTSIPEFQASTSEGDVMSRASLSGVFGVVAFLSGDCQACSDEAGNLARAVLTHAFPRTAAIVSGTGHGRETVMAHLGEACTVIVDDNGTLTQAFGVQSVPTILAIDSGGVVTDAAGSLSQLAAVYAS
jgi:hypothetical protein